MRKWTQKHLPGFMKKEQKAVFYPISCSLGILDKGAGIHYSI